MKSSRDRQIWCNGLRIWCQSDGSLTTHWQGSCGRQIQEPPATASKRQASSSSCTGTATSSYTGTASSYTWTASLDPADWQYNKCLGTEWYRLRTTENLLNENEKKKRRTKWKVHLLSDSWPTGQVSGLGGPQPIQKWLRSRRLAIQKVHRDWMVSA